MEGQVCHCHIEMDDTKRYILLVYIFQIVWLQINVGVAHDKLFVTFDDTREYFCISSVIFLQLKGRPSTSNFTSRSRVPKACASSSVKCHNSGGRGALSVAVAVRADATPISSISSPDGAYTASRSTLQTRNIDGFSYGKQTVTNYVCNLCSASYKHHCNLLTHQVRIHGRPKKQLGRPPRPK